MKKPLLYSLSTISDPRYFSLAFIRGSVSRKTEDCETEEARSEAATHTFSILAFQYFSIYLILLRASAPLRELLFLFPFRVHSRFSFKKDGRLRDRRS